jgi:molecular chaperone DnaK
VTAKDRGTNNEQKITITSSSGLSKDEVEKMAKDGESHAAEDRKQRDTIEARNRADAMVYNVEKTLKEHRSKIGEAEAKEIESAIEETKKAMAENDPERTNAAVDRLTAASHKLAEAMYKTASSQPGGAPPPPTDGDKPKDGKKDDVVDAEFVDVDDKDKK